MFDVVRSHLAFQAVRQLLLQAERRDPGSAGVGEGILYLAENVAKVTYNTSGQPCPFDHDSGWWVVSNVRWIVDRVGDQHFEERAWNVLANTKE